MGRRLLRANDILIETAGGSRERPTGRSVLVSQDVLDAFPGDVTCASFARFLRVDPDVASPRFIYWYLQHLYARGDMWMHQVQHTGVARFQFTRFSQTHKVQLPVRAEQEAVADVLGVLDDKIAVNERIAVTADELALALALDERWEKRIRLGEIADLSKVQQVPQELSDDLVDHYSLPAFDSRKAPDRCSPLSIKSGKFVIDSPAVLLSKLNPEIPRAWDVVPDGSVPSLASTEFLVLVPGLGISTHELWSVVAQRKFLEELAAKVTGTSKSHQRVRPAEVMETEVVDPRQFGEVGGQIRSLAQSILAARRESKTLATLRDTLLPQLMSGRLRVKDAEKIVEDHV
ncbi:hypothetical protein [Streptomyces rimosus]|uniref:hypothetical protein n=1 Tax=Streptomyces rimosus TaxID=1927 RepID=UPI0037976361